MNRENKSGDLEPTDIILSLPDQAATEKARALCKSGDVVFIRRLRTWIFRPFTPGGSFPSELAEFLPEAPPRQLEGRTYLSFRGTAAEAPHPGMRWDPAYSCWYYPANPESIPSSLVSIKPLPFSWAAWCQQQRTPYLSPCTAIVAQELISNSAILLCNELFRAAHSNRQPGFLYVRNSSSQRTFDLWSATLRTIGEHSVMVCVVTSESDEPLWRHILSFMGTSPASVVVITYRDLQYLAPTNTNPDKRRTTPSFRHTLRPNIIIWDHAHSLNTSHAKQRDSAIIIAKNADFNLWVTDNPASRLDDVTPFLDLLNSRSPSSCFQEYIASLQAPEPWLTWHGSVQNKPISTAIGETLFARNSSGTLGGLVIPRPSNATIEFRPVPRPRERAAANDQTEASTIDSSARAIHCRSMMAALIPIVSSLLAEGSPCCIISEDDEALRMGAAEVGKYSKALIVGSGHQENDFRGSIDEVRCIFSHRVHFNSLCNFRRGSYRTVLFTSIPTSVQDFASLAPGFTQHAAYVLPYFEGSTDAELLSQFSLRDLSASLGPEKQLTIERY